MKEWPLVLFTLLTQLACGLTVAATVFEAKVPAANSALMRPLATVIFPLVAMGMLLSVAHLGRPLMSWRAFANLRRSRLSREIALTALFALLAFIYSGLWWTGRADGRLALGAATSVIGVAAVIAAAAVYTVPSQPAWNSAWVPASFLGSTLLLGGLAPALLISWGENTALLRIFLSAALAGSALLLIAAMWMARLSRREFATLGCHLALVSVLPAAVAFRLWPGAGTGTPFAAAALGAVVCGAAIGRAQMYIPGTRREPF